MQKNLSYSFFLILVFFVTVSFFFLIKDFLLACLWAVILAILFFPTYEKLKDHFKLSETTPLLLTIAIIILVFFIPFSTVSYLIIKESSNYYSLIESGQVNPQRFFVSNISTFWPENSKLSRVLGIDLEHLSSIIGKSFSQGIKLLAEQLPELTQNLLDLIVQFFLTFYILFFLLRDGRVIIRKLLFHIPLGDHIEIQLFDRFASVARATVKGGLIIAVIQGGIGGILFWSLDIPASFLWCVLMILLSLLPIGSVLIWAPAAIIFFLQGHILSSLIILNTGIFVIGLIDNFLRPRLVGKDIKMPDYLVLVSTLGGLTWFSLSGFVIGPMIAALFITCWEILGQNQNVNNEP